MRSVLNKREEAFMEDVARRAIQHPHVSHVDPTLVYIGGTISRTAMAITAHLDREDYDHARFHTLMREAVAVNDAGRQYLHVYGEDYDPRKMFLGFHRDFDLTDREMACLRELVGVLSDMPDIDDASPNIRAYFEHGEVQANTIWYGTVGDDGTDRARVDNLISAVLPAVRKVVNGYFPDVYHADVPDLWTSRNGIAPYKYTPVAKAGLRPGGIVAGFECVLA